MKKKESRRAYTQEFKEEAVQLVNQRAASSSVTEIAHNLGIHRNMLMRWVKEFNADPEHSFPGNGNLKAADEEMRQLKKQLRDVEEERDILKKALAIFSKKNNKVPVYIQSPGSIFS